MYFVILTILQVTAIDRLEHSFVAAATRQHVGSMLFWSCRMCGVASIKLIPSL